MRKSHTKRVVIGAAALSLLFAGSAFTAGTGVEDHTAGVGSATVSGVTVSSIEYVTSNNRTTLDNILFQDVGELGTDETAMTAEISIDGGTWTECTITAESAADAGDGKIDCPGASATFEDVASISLSVTSESIS